MSPRGELREVGEDSLLRHSPGEIPEDVADGNASAPDAGLRKPHSGIDRDAVK